MRSWVNPQYPKRAHLYHRTILRGMIQKEKCTITDVGGKSGCILLVFFWETPTCLIRSLLIRPHGHVSIISALSVCAHAYNRWCITLQHYNNPTMDICTSAPYFSHTYFTLKAVFGWADFCNIHRLFWNWKMHPAFFLGSSIGRHSNSILWSPEWGLLEKVTLIIFQKCWE